MERIKIYKTENMARSAAKFDYAIIIECSPKTLRLIEYKDYRYPNSVQCVCGQTLCLELYPRNLSLRQESKLIEYQQENGLNRNFRYGVCSSCGEKF